MLYAIVFLIIVIASFLFAMLGLGGGMVYVPIFNRTGFDMVSVADDVFKKKEYYWLFTGCCHNRISTGWTIHD